MGNPISAHTLYIADGKHDRLYRIHTTLEWWTIGKDVSSSCFHMFNQDIIDLYNRVPPGAKIIVK